MGWRDLSCWTSGSTFRTAAGKAADCGARTRPHAPAQSRRQRLNATRRAHPVSARSAVELRFAEEFERSVARDCGAFALSYVPSDRIWRKAVFESGADDSNLRRMTEMLRG